MGWNGLGTLPQEAGQLQMPAWPPRLYTGPACHLGPAVPPGWPRTAGGSCRSPGWLPPPAGLSSLAFQLLAWGPAGEICLPQVSLGSQYSKIPRPVAPLGALLRV